MEIRSVGVNTQGFALDRRVPLGFVLALLLQAAAAVWWAAGKDAQDMSRDRRLNEIAAIELHDQNYQLQVIERLARLEAQNNANAEMLRQIAAGLVKK